MGISAACLAIRLGDGERKLESAVMVVDTRISDSELAAINAAAVTREYRVQPHLGMFPTTPSLPGLLRHRLARLSHCIRHQWVKPNSNLLAYL